jgi:hypothetical protein
MKRFLILLLVIAAIGGTYFGLLRLRYTTGMRVNMERSAAEMATEVKECRERLAMFHTAWSRYRKAHGNSDPVSVSELIPMYVKSPDLLVCPTAKRLTEGNRKVAQGTLRVGDDSVPMTYEFHWSYGDVGTGPAADKATLVVCPVHQEVIARYVYLKDPATYVVSPETEKRIEELGGVGRLLVVRRDGTVTTTDKR